jgi:helix-turn-helix protein
MQKFRDVLSQWERRELSKFDAGELLGMPERQFRRYRQRYEDEGLAGLVDKRLGKASTKRVPVDKIAWIKYPPAEPGALRGEPLKAAGRGRRCDLGRIARWRSDEDVTRLDRNDSAPRFHAVQLVGAAARRILNERVERYLPGSPHRCSRGAPRAARSLEDHDLRGCPAQGRRDRPIRS